MGKLSLASMQRMTCILEQEVGSFLSISSLYQP